MTEKGPLDVYREAADEYHMPNEGCAAGCAIVLCVVVFLILRWFGVTL